MGFKKKNSRGSPGLSLTVNLGGEPPTELSRVLFGFLKVFIFIVWMLFDKKSHPTTAHSDGDSLPPALPGRAAAAGGPAGAGRLRVATRGDRASAAGNGRDAPPARGPSSQRPPGPAGALEGRSCGASWWPRLRSPPVSSLRQSELKAGGRGGSDSRRGQSDAVLQREGFGRSYPAATHLLLTPVYLPSRTLRY